MPFERDLPPDAFGLIELKLAFARHVVERILGADGELARAEVQFLDQRFPPSLLVRYGFLTADGTFTERFQRATRAALVELPLRLTREEKLGLVDLLFEATLSDGEFHHAEGQGLVDAARLLDLPGDALDAHLSSRRAQVADIELTTQEWQQDE